MKHITVNSFSLLTEPIRRTRTCTQQVLYLTFLFQHLTKKIQWFPLVDEALIQWRASPLQKQVIVRSFLLKLLCEDY